MREGNVQNVFEPLALTTLSAKVYMLSVLLSQGHNAFNSRNQNLLSKIFFKKIENA